MYTYVCHWAIHIGYQPTRVNVICLGELCSTDKCEEKKQGQLMIAAETVLQVNIQNTRTYQI